MPALATLSLMSRASAFIPCAAGPRARRLLQRGRRLCVSPPARRRTAWGRPGSGRLVALAGVDLRFVKDNVAAVRQNILDRGVSADADRVVSLYDAYVALSREADDVRRRRNENAAQMKRAGKMEKAERDACVAEGRRLKMDVARLEEQLVQVEAELDQEAARIPNMTHPDVPRGDEDMARVVEVVGEKRDFAAEGVPVEAHVDVALRHDLVDFERAAKVAGNKFYYLRNEGALLELALVNWAMTMAMRRGFTPMTTPDVAREEVVSGCGFAPRGEASQVYRVEDSDLCLVGTAEIPLGGYYAGQILAKEELPVKMAAFSHCFRKEVGAAGTTTRGLYRVHQFSKVEMFVLAHPDDSVRLHDELRDFERDLYESLGLHFRVLDMPTKDLGNPASRKFDIEAWMPGRGGFGEISSASNCTDYQARRLNVRYREKQGDNRYVHTLNATACAVPRLIVAILETHVQKDGRVRVPDVLRPYMGGLEYIGGGGAKEREAKAEAEAEAEGATAGVPGV